jgi:hypothetical protein
MCTRYAQFKSPARFATANADSYVWLATAKYFTSNGQGVYTRADAEESNDPDSVADPNQTFDSPDESCEANGTPALADCQQIQIPTDFNDVNLDSGACYTNGNRKWCDMYTSGSCQITIGWDTTENGGKSPFLTNNELASYQTNNFGQNECSPYTQNSPGACVIPQGTPCITSYTFCMKRVGYQCGG